MFPTLELSISGFHFLFHLLKVLQLFLKFSKIPGILSLVAFSPFNVAVSFLARSSTFNFLEFYTIHYSFPFLSFNSLLRSLETDVSLVE